MIKLKTNFKTLPNPTFYFYDMQDCNKFLSILKENNCNPPWEEIEKVESVDDNDLGLDPKDRANIWLYWLTFNTGLDIEQLNKE